MPGLAGPSPVRARDELLDASVLFQEPVRGLLLWIAADGVFSPRWTTRILDEVGRNLLKMGFVTTEQWQRLAATLHGAFPDALVDQQAADQLEADMPNDPKDRHVLAAAVAGNVDRVVTNNLKHFKAEDLATVGKESIDADAFLCDLLERAPLTVRDALHQQARVMRRPRQWTAEELLGRLAGLGPGDALAPNFVAAVEQRLAMTPQPPPERPDSPRTTRTSRRSTLMR